MACSVRGRDAGAGVVTGNHVVTTFAPVLVNGVPYVPEPETVPVHRCHCRRCLLHDDPGGCVAVPLFVNADGSARS